MPQRTDNDIKNRWNSIIRKPQHPAGRDWLADENEARAAILGTASRTQVGRRGGAAAAPSAEAGRKRERSASGAGGSAQQTKAGRRKLAGASVEYPDSLGPAAPSEHFRDVDLDESPNPGRKLFESPEAVHYNDSGSADDDDALVASDGQQRAAAEDDDDGDEEDVGLAAADEAEACRMLVGGEIAADTFDVDAFLPVAAAAMGSLSQMSSPAGEGKPRPRSGMAQDWFDPELDSSLSPILTPSLRHQLRALMATPRAGGSSSNTPAGSQHLLGLGAALTAAVPSLVSNTLATHTPSASPEAGADAVGRVGRSGGGGGGAAAAPPPRKSVRNNAAA